MKHSRFGIIKSGTSTLEAGYFSLPMIVVYKTSFISYLIGKNLIRIKNIAMANGLLNENVVPELIQNQMNEINLYNICEKILLDKNSYEKIKSKLGKIPGLLGEEGASGKAAVSILALMNEN